MQSNCVAARHDKLLTNLNGFTRPGAKDTTIR